MINKVTYRQQYTRCGKERCRKCREGSGHGPYWYAYWSEKGRTVSKYIGTQLPAHLATSSNIEEGLTPPLKPPETGTYSQDIPLIRIYLLGQFRIEYYHQGKWQAADSYTSHRRRTRALLGCLLSNPSRRLGREQAMEMLWPGLDIDLAANRLNGAVHELRQTLEPDIARPSSSRLLRLERDIFELSGQKLVWIDAEEFEQLLKKAEMCTDTQQAERLLEAAATLYQGNYLLEELYSEWAVPRRDALQRAWIDLQLRLVQIKVAQEAYISAIENLDRLRIADPTNETALQQLMILLTHLDRRAEALQVYKQYSAMLERDYEGQPLAETVALYEKLRKGHVPPLFATDIGTELAPTQKKAAPVPPSMDPPDATAPPVPDTQAVDQEETSNTLSYTRPAFQPVRHHQSPLIGREQEQQRMRQLLLTIEQQTGLLASTETEMSLSLPSPTDSSQPAQTHFLLLIGEPGIGKTRLVEELSIDAYNRGWTVAWSRSYEQESAIPYHPWTEILRTLIQSDTTFAQLMTTSTLAETVRDQEAEQESKNQSASQLKLDQLSALLPELADHVLSTRLSPGLSHEQQRLRLCEATLGLITTLSEFHPLLLVFDDLHWADASSIDLLTYLTHHLQSQRVLLIGTCRDGELEPQHKLRVLTAELQRKHAIAMIAAQPLTPAQIRTLVSYLPEKFIASIQAQSSGNPFFAEELARFICKSGEGGKPFPYSARPGEQEQLDAFYLTRQAEWEKVPSSPGSPPTLPDAITAVLERRLHRLSSGCHTLLSRAAVLGDAFALEQLRLMAPEHNEDTILDLLEEAQHAGLLTEKGMGAHITYHFWHPLIITYLYSRLSAARRAQLLRRAGRLSATNEGDAPESNHADSPVTR